MVVTAGRVGGHSGGLGTGTARWGRPQRSVAMGGLVFAAYLALGVIAFWHVWTGHPTSVAPGYGGGDSAMEEWFLAWVPWAIAHGHNPLLSTWANYPSGVNLVDNTSVLALGFAGSPVTAIWGPVATLNLWWTLAFPLSGSAGYLLARRFTDRRAIAWFGGLLYGFGPYAIAQGAGHLNLVFVPLPALTFVVLHDIVVRQDRSPLADGIRLAVVVVVQFLISSEVLATTALFAAVAVVVVAAANRRAVAGHVAHIRRSLIVAAPIAAVALAYPVYLAFAGPGHIHGTVLGYRYYYSSFLAPVLPSSLFPVATHHLHVLGDRLGGNIVENGTYLGLPLVAVLIVAPFVVRRKAVVLACLLTAAAFVLSLGVTFHAGVARFDRLDATFPMPAAVLYKTPVINQAFPVRYSLFVDLFAAVAVTVVVDGAVTAWRRRRSLGLGRWGGVATCALVAAVAVPLLPAWPYGAQGRVGVPRFFTSAAALGRIPVGSVALVYPMSTDTDANAELWQATAGFRFKMPGGYFVLPAPGGSNSVYTDPTLAEVTFTALLHGPAPARDPVLRNALRAELGAWGVRSVIAQTVGRDPVGFFRWLLGRPADQRVGGVEIWHGLHLA